MQVKIKPLKGPPSQIVLSYSSPLLYDLQNLCVENEADANLVGSLVKLLGIERATDTESNTGAEEDVVRDCSDTTVVDLGLVPIR
jgi:hypothetical protein